MNELYSSGSRIRVDRNSMVGVAIDLVGEIFDRFRRRLLISVLIEAYFKNRLCFWKFTVLKCTFNRP